MRKATEMHNTKRCVDEREREREERERERDRESEREGQRRVTQTTIAAMRQGHSSYLKQYTVYMILPQTPIFGEELTENLNMYTHAYIHTYLHNDGRSSRHARTTIEALSRG